MIKGIYTSGAAMRAGVVRQDITANNLANSETAGFKRDRFVLEQQVSGDSAISQKQLLDSVSASRYTSFNPGPIESTESPLDFALQGAGFFVVADETGQSFTRNGRFDRNSDGLLVDASGRRVQGQGGDITLPPGVVSVSERGEISVDGAPIDRVRVVNFSDTLALEKTGDGLFADPRSEAGQLALDSAVIQQGFLEQSNVDAVQEMVEMIATSRNYEASSRLMMTQDASLNHVVNDIGRV